MDLPTVRELDRTRAPDTVQAALRLYLLGSFRITLDGRTLEEATWRRRKAAALVKLLALAPGHRLHREQVLDELWPDLDPDAAANNLHQTLHVVRRLLEPAPGSPTRFLRLQGDQVVLSPSDPVWVDVEAFEDAVAEARRTGDLVHYRAALQLYTGDLLPGDLYEDWAASRRERLRQMCLQLYLELAQLAQARGDLSSAVDALQRAIKREPALEEAHVSLMRLYAASGHRGQAVRQYEQLRAALAQELDAEPEPESRALYQEILAGRLASLPGSPKDRPSATPRRHNLPSLVSSFIGREREMAMIEGLLRTTRLLTLTGTGGTGKTRLAIQVAGSLVEQYRDGAWLVELASLSDPELIPQAVAAALAVAEQPSHSLTRTLAESLSTKELLLVLDNCEHLIDGCAQLVETLLHACPELRVVATSREALNLGGEVRWQVPPLPVPDPQPRPSLAELTQSASVRLFTERVRYRQPDFDLTEDNAAAVAQICRRLEGMPLAIELATARVGVLGVEAIAQRLDDVLDLLTVGSRTAEPRQHTLRRALDWSYQLLDRGEQQLFERFSVFAGGWSLEAAEAVGAGGEVPSTEVLDLLSHLADKSLVAAEDGGEGEVRYRFLEPVRQYARRRLEERGETGAVRRAHAQFFADLAVESRPALRGPAHTTWMARLERDKDNFRAAFEWSLSDDGDTALALRLAANLWWPWYTRGYLRETSERLAVILERAPDDVTADRAETLRGAGVLASAQGKYEQAITFLEGALDLYRALDLPKDVANTLNSLGIIATEQDDLERAIAYHEEALRLRRQIDDKHGIGISLLNIGFAVHQQDDLERSRALHQESLAIGRELGDQSFIALSLHNLGYIAIGQDDPSHGVELLTESLALYRDIGDQRRITSCLEGLAAAASQQGRYDRAATLYGASSALRQAIGAPMYARQQAHWERSVAEVRDALGEDAFASRWEAGNTMPADEMVDYALALPAARV